MSRKTDDKQNRRAVPSEVSEDDRLSHPGSPEGSHPNVVLWHILRSLRRLEEGQRNLDSKVSVLESRASNQEIAMAEFKQVLGFMKWPIPILVAIGIAWIKYL